MGRPVDDENVMVAVADWERITGQIGDCFVDRLRDHTFLASQVRFVLYPASCWLLTIVRRWLQS